MILIPHTSDVLLIVLARVKIRTMCELNILGDIKEQHIFVEYSDK